MEHTIRVVDIVTIFALFSGPILAVWVGRLLALRQEKRSQKLWVLHSLVASRHTILADDRIRAINLVELIFSKDQNVRRVHREYMEVLIPSQPNAELTENELTKIQAKMGELIEAISKSLGLHNTYSALDYSRAYIPKFYSMERLCCINISCPISDFL